MSIVVLLSRRPGMGIDEFHSYWRDHHGPLVARNPAGRRHIRRYEQHHRLPAAYEKGIDSDYDGAAIQSFDSMADFLTMISDPEWAEITADEQNFLDRDRLRWIVTQAPDVFI